MIIANTTKTDNVMETTKMPAPENKEISDKSMESRKSLLDYLFISGQLDEPMKSETYDDLRLSSMKNRYNLSEFYRFSECENVAVNHKYDITKINRKDKDYDVWYTVDKDGRKTTPYMHYNEDKIHYLANFYAKNGGDLSQYPFPDDEMTKDTYIGLVKTYAGKVIREAQIAKVFEDSGVDACVMKLDIKGEVYIETEDENKAEKLRENFLADKMATGLRTMIFGKSEYAKSMSNETKIYKSEQVGMRWSLYRHHGIVVDDLSINEEGEVEGLPEIFKDYDPLFFDIVKGGILSKESSNQIIGTFIYKDGKVYFQ